MVIEMAMISTAFPAFPHAGASFSQGARFRVRRRGAGARAGNEVPVALPGAPLPAPVSETVGVVPLPGRPEGSSWIVTDVSSLVVRSEEHTSELQSRGHLVCRLLLEQKNK